MISISMIDDKNLYHILELEADCTHDQIRQSYKKLATRYHPDKYNGPIQDKAKINDKFIDIRNAYEILSDPDKRKSYDLLELSQQGEFYDRLKAFIKANISDDIDLYIKLFFDDDSVLKEKINNFDVFGIYNQIVSRIRDSDVVPFNENITGTIYATMSERYNDKYRKLKIKRKTRDDITIFVPLNKKSYVLPHEGEMINGTTGNIILQIESFDTLPENYLIDTNILYITEYISLYEYLYGGELTVNIFGNDLFIPFDSFIERFPTITLKGKGFMITPDDTPDDTPDEDKRGDLCIIFKIKSLNEIRHQVKKINH